LSKAWEPADIFGELIGIAAGVIIGEDDESEVGPAVARGIVAMHLSTAKA
jgi:hypothetical protein